eukprot:s2662_g3.t1
MRVLLPHEVLAALAESQSYVFESVLLGHLPDDARVAFWKHVSDLEPWKDHPVINHCSWERLVGIHIHGDGCEFYKDDEYFVWSWSSIFATAGSIKDVLMFRFPIAVVPERLMRTASATHLILVIEVCTGIPISQVRDEVHRKIAELTAWSMEFAGSVTDALPFKGTTVQVLWITEMLALLQRGI